MLNKKILLGIILVSEFHFFPVSSLLANVHVLFLTQRTILRVDLRQCIHTLWVRLSKLDGVTIRVTIGVTIGVQNMICKLQQLLQF